MTATENPETLEPRTVDSSSEGSNPSRRTEIDTSAPFESVKEAANRFGGMGFWKPSSRKPSELSLEHYDEVIDVAELEERAEQLERDLIAKERETLDVLKELESSKITVEQLKANLQKEASEINSAIGENGNGNVEFNLCPSSAPGLILLELKHAKLNLTRTTTDLADIRATVEQYNKKIEHERASLEKTRKRLTSNTSKISSLEEELKTTRQIHAEVQDGPHESSDIATQLQKLSSETEQFKKAGQAAQSQVQKAMSEIEQTRASIRTAEIKLIAAKRMKEAALASERVALADIRLLTKKTGGAHQESDENVTISVEEYSSLVQKVRESERTCETRVEEAMVGVEEANVSRADFLKRVEEALEEVKISKRDLEEALERVEIANRDKLAAEETFRALRLEHDHKSRSSVQNPTKFKSSNSSSRHRRESILADGSDEAKPVLKATLSIGEILSRKLMLTEEYENGTGKGKTSFGRMLSKPSSCDPCKKSKNFGLGRISVLVVKQSKKKNKKD